MRDSVLTSKSTNGFFFVFFFYKIVVDAVVITTKWLGKGGLSPSPLKIFQKMRLTRL